MADYSTVLSTADVNEGYDNFIIIYKSLFEISCPVKHMKVKKNYIKREPWISSGILTSSLNKAKLLGKELSRPNPETINKCKEYCRVFSNIKRAAKRAYYAEMLEARKHNVKEAWAILRQAIHKQKEFSKFPEAFIINGHEETNMKKNR